MGRSLARARSTDLEARRLRGIQMVGRGTSQADVARRLGVTREAVRQWVRAWREGGAAALAPRRHVRRRRVELTRVAHALARARRSTRQILTTGRVLDLIDRVFGVAYSASGVRAILGQLGFSYSRAAGWHLVRLRPPPTPVAARRAPRVKCATFRASG